LVYEAEKEMSHAFAAASGSENCAPQTAVHPHQTHPTQEKTAMTKLPISVCVIAGAEAGRIGRLLASVAGWTSEIIVVLNEGLEDGTEGVAASHGAKTFRHSWSGFRGQKNLVLGHATQPWVLSLDADEAVFWRGSGPVCRGGICAEGLVHGPLDHARGLVPGPRAPALPAR
jgi:hypothetical protein